MSGFAFYERSLALYRDWELIDVLAAAVANSRSEELVAKVNGLRPLVETGHHQEASDYVDTAIRPAVDGKLKVVLDDLVTALREPLE